MSCKCSQGKETQETRVTSEGTGRFPTYTAMKSELREAGGIPGTLWAGLRPHATLPFYSYSWILQEGAPSRTRGQPLGEERVLGEQ